jgi:leucyl-tRNA synthetase
LKEIEQWSMRITAYIDRLLTDLNELEWSESLKLMQKNWIGKSTGAEIEFRLEQNQDHILKVFTTRPDTIF